MCKTTKMVSSREALDRDRPASVRVIRWTTVARDREVANETISQESTSPEIAISKETTISREITTTNVVPVPREAVAATLDVARKTRKMVLS